MQKRERQKEQVVKTDLEEGEGSHSQVHLTIGVHNCTSEV